MIFQMHVWERDSVLKTKNLIDKTKTKSNCEDTAKNTEKKTRQSLISLTKTFQPLSTLKKITYNLCSLIIICNDAEQSLNKKRK